MTDAAAAVADVMKSNPDFREQLKQDPEAALAQIQIPLQSDVWIYRMVVAALGGTVIIAMVGSLVLAFHANLAPDVVTALGSAAIGALAGLLVPSPARSK